MNSDFKNHMRNLDNFRPAVESPKRWNAMGYICLKTAFLNLKYYLQIYLTLLSTDLWFGKWNEGYGQFSPEHLKVSKLKFLMGSFNPKLKKYKLKIHRGVIRHENEEWQNLKRNWLVISTLIWGIWRILTRVLESLKNFHFNVLLLNKVYIFWAKKVKRSYLS